MREIKFRAWDNHSHKMIYIQDELPKYRGFEIMQFTGLKDKNGKEIFEGDIVEFCTKWEFPQRFKGQVIYFPESMQYGFSENGESYYDFTDIENPEILEVIGNIYENPELLSPKKSEEV